MPGLHDPGVIPRETKIVIFMCSEEGSRTFLGRVIEQSLMLHDPGQGIPDEPIFHASTQLVVL